MKKIYLYDTTLRNGAQLIKMIDKVVSYMIPYLL